MSTRAAIVPVSSWICLNAATGILLAVSPRRRARGLPVIAILAIVSFTTSGNLNFIPGLPELWGTISLIGFIHFFSLLYIKRWSLLTDQDSRKVNGSRASILLWLNGKLWTRMYQTASNPRFIRVRYKTVILPEQADGAHELARSTATYMAPFSWRRIIWLCVKIASYLALHQLAANNLLPLVEISDFDPSKAELLRNSIAPSVRDLLAGAVLSKDMVMRIWFTLQTIWTPVLLLDCIHAMLAVFFIYVIRVDVAEDWPDLFGSPLQAFTLARYWTRFWHRIHLSAYSDCADLLIETIFPRRMIQSAVLRKTLSIWLLFMISGAIYQLTSWHLHPTCSNDYVDMQFYLLNAAVVILESAMPQSLSSNRASTPTNVEEQESKNAGSVLKSLRTGMVRLLGYGWVFVFLVWVIPHCYYGRVHCAIKNQQRLETIEALAQMMARST